MVIKREEGAPFFYIIFFSISSLFILLCLDKKQYLKKKREVESVNASPFRAGEVVCRLITICPDCHHFVIFIIFFDTLLE